jgi:hypothetical protein
MAQNNNIIMPANKNELIILNNQWIEWASKSINSGKPKESQEFWECAAYKFFDLSDDTDLDRYSYAVYIMRYTGQLGKELDELSINVFNKGKVYVPRLTIRNGKVTEK